MNKVILIGNVGADSEMKFTPGGIPVANFSLAVNPFNEPASVADDQDIPF